MKFIFTRYRILGCYFVLSTLKVSLHCLQDYIVTIKKSAITHILVHLFITWSFPSGCFEGVLLITDFSQFLMVLAVVSFMFHDSFVPGGGVSSFSSNLEKGAHFSFKYFSSRTPIKLI